MKGRDRVAILLAAAAAAAAPALVMAAETIVYRYDGRGRLVEVERKGSLNDKVVTKHGYDKSNNRIVKTTLGSPNPPPP